jgi:hypothetical protein
VRCDEAEAALRAALGATEATAARGRALVEQALASIGEADLRRALAS